MKSPVLLQVDQHYQINQKVRANYYAAYEENDGGKLVVALLDDVHDVGPAFERSALEDGQIGRAQIVKICDSVVQFLELAVAHWVDVFVDVILLLCSIWTEQLQLEERAACHIALLVGAAN